jgi:glycosyltransferase involved in cell wall biosynthesis
VRILHINDYACLIGGAETYLAALMSAQRENGDIVALLASDSRGGGTFEIYPEERGYFDSQLFLAHGTSSSNQAVRAGLQLINISAYRAAQKAIKEFRPEIVHVHMYLGQLSPMVLRPFIDLAIPLVHTSHAYRIVCPKGDRLLPGNVFCEKPVSLGCIRTCYPVSYVHMKSRELLHQKPQEVFQLVISPGSIMKRILEMEGFPRVIHLPHGSNFKMREFIADRNHAMDVLYVGRLAFNKGVDNLITAFKQVRRKFPHVRLRIAGDGPARASLEKMASDSLPEASYEFLGAVDSQRVMDLQDHARLQCVPSVCPENSPIVIYEALTAGVPVVASNIGGIPDLVRNGKDGILITPGNTNELAAAIEALFDDQACISFAQAAYDRAKDFSMDKHITALQKLYRDASQSKDAK